MLADPIFVPVRILWRKRKTSGENVLGLKESRRDAQERPEALRHVKPGSDQQDQGDGHLSDNQRTPQAGLARGDTTDLPLCLSESFALTDLD